MLGKTSLTARRALAVGAATVAVFVGAQAAPAAANTNACAKNTDGCAWFTSDKNSKHKGDTFTICDYKPDNLSVTVYYGRPNAGTRRHVTNWRGKGCRDFTRNGPERRSVDWQVCLTRYGRPGGKKMQHVPGSCSIEKYDVY
jgi:hypothetical protein